MISNTISYLIIARTFSHTDLMSIDYNNRLVNDNNESTLNNGDKSISCKGPLIWNELDKNNPHFVNYHSKGSFKSNLKIFYISTDE